LTRSANWADVVDVRKRRAFTVTILAAHPLVVFGRNVVFPPDPVGMRLYQAHHLTELMALSLIVCAFLLGCLLHVARRKSKTGTLEDGWSYEI